MSNLGPWSWITHSDGPSGCKYGIHLTPGLAEVRVYPAVLTTFVVGGFLEARLSSGRHSPPRINVSANPGNPRTSSLQLATSLRRNSGLR